MGRGKKSEHSMGPNDLHIQEQDCQVTLGPHEADGVQETARQAQRNEEAQSVLAELRAQLEAAKQEAVQLKAKHAKEVAELTAQYRVLEENRMDPNPLSEAHGNKVTNPDAPPLSSNLLAKPLSEYQEGDEIPGLKISVVGSQRLAWACLPGRLLAKRLGRTLPTWEKRSVR